MNPATVKQAIEVSVLRLEPGQCVTIFMARPDAPCGCGQRIAGETVQVEIHVTADGKPRVVLSEKDSDCLTTFQDAYPGQFKAALSSGKGGGT